MYRRFVPTTSFAASVAYANSIPAAITVYRLKSTDSSASANNGRDMSRSELYAGGSATAAANVDMDPRSTKADAIPGKGKARGGGFFSSLFGGGRSSADSYAATSASSSSSSSYTSQNAKYASTASLKDGGHPSYTYAYGYAQPIHLGEGQSPREMGSNYANVSPNVDINLGQMGVPARVELNNPNGLPRSEWWNTQAPSEAAGYMNAPRPSEGGVARSGVDSYGGWTLPKHADSGKNGVWAFPRSVRD